MGILGKTLNRVLATVVALMIVSTAYAAASPDMFYRQTTYMVYPFDSGEAACDAVDGVPASLFGNREAVQTEEVISTDGNALTISGLHQDGTRDTYTFFLKKSDCEKFARTLGLPMKETTPSSQNDTTWYLVAPAKGQCIVESSTGPGLDTPEAMARFASSLSQRVHIQYNPQNPDIAMLIDDRTGATSMAFVRGADHCDFMLRKMMTAQ